MSDLSSASTRDEVDDAYDDNASWFEDASVAKARAFHTAVTILLRRSTTFASKGGASFSYNVEQLSKQQALAAEYIAASKPVAEGGTGMIYHDVSKAH